MSAALPPRAVGTIIEMVADRLKVRPQAIQRSGSDLPLGFMWRGSQVTFHTTRKGLALQTKGLVESVLRPAIIAGDTLHDIADKTRDALAQQFEGSPL